MRALVLQVAITLVFILKPDFKAVLVYAGFVLNLFTFLTVLGVFVLRWRQPLLPRPYRAWGYPFTPLLFLALSAWTLVFIIKDKPTESLYGLLTIGQRPAGVLGWWPAAGPLRRFPPKRASSSLPSAATAY